MLPLSFCNTGSTTFLISLQCPAAVIITVPGEITSSFLYFCFIERESFPVGTLIPRAILKSLMASTALYKRASSPGLLQGHIQLADNEILFTPFSRGAQIILVRDSVIAFLDPATGSISPEIGECPILVATPCLPL